MEGNLPPGRRLNASQETSEIRERAQTYRFGKTGAPLGQTVAREA